MPIKKRNNKWYYGSKGPFDTRDEAVEVAQAIHAEERVKKRDKGLKKK